MRIAIIIPAHNEGNYIRYCLDSFIAQSLRPDLLVVVDDNSTDDTVSVVSQYESKNSWIKLASFTSSEQHLPGAKVVKAFNHGLTQIDDSFDFIGKFDADIILPVNYFEEVFREFMENDKLGICSGVLYVEKDNRWVYERIADKSHIRGPVKLYRKTCLDAIGGLRPGIGWDTADVLLAPYYGYSVKTLTKLKVKHLRPTGATYRNKRSLMQGRSYYGLRYGVIISLLAAIKMSWNKRSLPVIWHSLIGYHQARSEKAKPLVAKEEGAFIRLQRWKKIRQALF